MYWIVGLAVAALTVVLLSPLRLRARVARDDVTTWQVEAEWLGGLVAFRRSETGAQLFIAGMRRQLTPGGDDKASPHASWRDRLTGTEKMRAWLTKQRRRALGRLLRDVWRAVKVEIQGEGWYGLADPAVTAWLHASLCALQTMPGVTLRAEPDFCREGWAGYLEGKASARLMDMVVPAARFLAAAFISPVMKKYKGGRIIWQGQG